MALALQAAYLLTAVLERAEGPKLDWTCTSIPHLQREASGNSICLSGLQFPHL